MTDRSASASYSISATGNVSFERVFVRLQAEFVRDCGRSSSGNRAGLRAEFVRGFE